MRYIWQHTRFVIDNYTGDLPLSHYLKNYFRQHKQLGSRDRKMISEMVYGWYRCSKALPENLSFEEKMTMCLFICDTTVRQVVQLLPEKWLQNINLSTEQKIARLQDEGIAFDLDKLLPFPTKVSAGLSKAEWLQAMLRQPQLFIRVRKETERITEILRQEHIAFDFIGEHCISLPNGTPVDKLLPPAWYVVQDASSQATGNFFKPQKKEAWWDCCSGAGGKSLLLKDIEPSLQLTVSDKRASILHNLTSRFTLYGHRQPEQVIVDVSDSAALQQALAGRLFDHIICDVPCSGSGTWGRTTEQLFFFDEASPAAFSALQRKIATNALNYLKPGGTLYYITCSIFEAENEAVVNELCKTGATLLHQQILNGVHQKADSMFIAELTISA